MKAFNTNNCRASTLTGVRVILIHLIGPQYQTEFDIAVNHLSVEDFKLFVNWCHKNPRDLDEIIEDKRSSIQI